ncbi:MAG: hypothetical protein K9N06_05320 [Candidatus Cloacimonetes bacterium]|nr:hypothetical protein [Candidatus Cloacimonadota bacterium]
MKGFRKNLFLLKIGGIFCLYKLLLYCILMLCITFISACDIKEKSLRQYGREGEIDKLANFVNKYKLNQNKDKLIKCALEEIVTSDSENSEVFISELLKDKMPEMRRYWIYKCHNNEGKIIHPWEQVISDFYFAETEILKSEISILLNNYSIEENDDICQAYRDMIIKHQSELSVYQTKIKLADFYQLPVSESSIKAIEELNQKIDDYFFIIDGMSEVENRNSYLDDGFKILHSELAELEELIENSKSIIYLEAYIVLERSYMEYEIALPEYDFYYGQHPSDRHAILNTVDTEFSSKGLFHMYVMKLYQEPVQLKEEFGGFTQQWNVYLEIPGSYLSKIEAAKIEVEEKKNFINTCENEKDEMEKNLQILREAASSFRDNLTSELEKI